MNQIVRFNLPNGEIVKPEYDIIIIPIIGDQVNINIEDKTEYFIVDERKFTTSGTLLIILKNIYQ
jgi:hypothetical protein